ncbi:MAG: DNA modification methylase [Planctomycetes bacterium]|nr:DNA modification methylase [Planctomycetota bacterium]MBI3833372.1 DNA modification methylase [Planctomycetota bacterium]
MQLTQKQTFLKPADVPAVKQPLPDREMTSLVSYPVRGPWGDASYRGNCDGTLFRDLIRRYRPRRVADPMMGSGTTKDVIAELNRCENSCIEYWGSDLRMGFDVVAEPLPGPFDLVWVHPPYWNIIRYSDDAADLSTCETFDEFIGTLFLALRQCYDAVFPGGRMAVLMGDVRRNRCYYPIAREVMNMAGPLGELRSVIIKAQHNCRSDHVTYASMEDVPIQHEYCLIFKKNIMLRQAA